jgi:hypothetical protein
LDPKLFPEKKCMVFNAFSSNRKRKKGKEEGGKKEKKLLYVKTKENVNRHLYREMA